MKELAIAVDGAANENVEPAQLGDDSCHHRLHGRLIADIHGQKQHPAAKLSDLAGELLGLRLVAQIIERHVGPFPSERPGRSQADAGRGAGDQGRFPRELHGGDVRRLIVD